MKVSIIIPVYNEAATIRPLLEKVAAVALPANVSREIIVVDDGSRDDTGGILEDFAQRPGMHIFNRSENEGKTAAVRYGLAQVQGDVVIIQDADLEYDPSHYPDLLAPILAKKAAVVYGSRFKGTIQGMTWVNRLANRVSNLTMNAFFHAGITDFHTGFKAFRRDVLDGIEFVSARFSFDTELTAKLLDKGCAIVEVPVHYVARKADEGKKITWANALETYMFLLRFCLRRKRRSI